MGQTIQIKGVIKLYKKINTQQYAVYMKCTLNMIKSKNIVCIMKNKHHLQKANESILVSENII